MERLLALAERHHGVIAVYEAWALGVSEAELRSALREGHLARECRGVYRVQGSVPTWQQRVMVRVLAAGPGAAASHRTAAALLGLPGFTRARIEVARVWKRSRNTRPHWLHESTYLPPDHLTVIDGIPCVRIDRTLFDLCGVLFMERSKAVLKSALSRKLTTYGRLEKTFFETARRGRKGSAFMRAFLDNYDEKAVTESELEDMVETVLASGHIIGFRRQVDLGNDEKFIGRRDWKHETAPLVIEAHSAEFHTDWAVQSADYYKSLESSAIGVRTIPVTFRILVEHPEVFLAAVRTELATFPVTVDGKGGEFGEGA
jgi:predicted transcriptional regulator of viral defense system